MKNEAGFWLVILVGLICAMVFGTCSYSEGRSAGARESRLPCLNSEAVQVALDGCIAARLKLPEAPTRGRADDLFEVCREWSMDVACVRASVPAGVKP